MDEGKLSKIEENVKEMDLVISTFLRIGILTSSVIILTGLLMFLISGKSGYPGTSYPTHPMDVFKGCLNLKPYAIIMLGLMVLIAIPVLRVAVSIIVFFKEKDFLYVKITTAVLIILIISFFMSKV
ncbi:putative membrane protein [Clostridium algifaecis]|uniref:Membrane protein n=1 Tax=Clostridium algifaecis TaxID=1472040 RepID=A0ABS4KRE0_9CLOT|nr:DUF1634 domain-containing protein [Clostridium algifaecis]MBP2032165.1 putative membrane protein [Clostridium algifaecis]